MITLNTRLQLQVFYRYSLKLWGGCKYVGLGRRIFLETEITTFISKIRLWSTFQLGQSKKMLQIALFRLNWYQNNSSALCNDCVKIKWLHTKTPECLQHYSNWSWSSRVMNGSSLFVLQCGWESCCLCWESSPYLLMPLHIWRDFSCKSLVSLQ